MDNFQNKNLEGDESDSASESSDGNNFLLKLIYPGKESTSYSQRSDKHEYQINISTTLRDPVILLKYYVWFQTNGRRLNAKYKRLCLKRSNHSSIFRRSIGSGIKGRPPKHVIV